MFNHNANAEELSTPETIPLDLRLKSLLALTNFRNDQGLEYFAPVRNVSPCRRCGAPVALVALVGYDVRWVDCFMDDGCDPHHLVWTANVLDQHVCAGCQQ